GPRGEPLARRLRVRGNDPWRQAPPVRGHRSPASSPPAAAARDAGLANFSDRRPGGRGERSGAGSDARPPPALLRAAGADAGLRQEEAPARRPPQGHGRDPGDRRPAPDPPARRAGGAVPPLPP